MQLEQSLIRKFENYQLVVLVNLSILCLVAFNINPDIFNYYVQYYLLILFVSIIGLPHGFFDYSIGKKMFGNHKSWVFKFSIGYVVISLAYLSLWYINPFSSLLIFLALAIYHFGMEELSHINYKDMSIIDIVTIGSIPIILPIMFHLNDVTFIFEQIIDLRVNLPETHWLIKTLYLGVISYVFYKLGYKRYLSYLVLIPSYILLPPLLSFVLYFCFHHSLRHYITSIYSDKLVPDSFTLKSFIISIVFASVCFTIMVVSILMNFSTYAIDVIIAKYTFILLACLTLPHLILNVYFEAKKNNYPSR